MALRDGSGPRRVRQLLAVCGSKRSRRPGTGVSLVLASLKSLCGSGLGCLLR
jgi:hypothetical protein